MPRADDAGDGGGRALRWRESALAGAGVRTFKLRLWCGGDNARVLKGVGRGSANLAGVTGGGDSARAPSCRDPRERVVTAREDVAVCVLQAKAME